MFGVPASHKRHGVSTVEFALVAPIFFMVVLGILEFGRMMMVEQVITNAAREGARVGVLDSATTLSVTNKVQDYLKAGGVSGATVKVSPDPPTTAKFNESVTITVSVPFKDVSWLPSPFILGGKTLSAEAIMRRETVE